MSNNNSKEEPLGPKARTRANSYNEASKPISMGNPSRRQTHSGAQIPKLPLYSSPNNQGKKEKNTIEYIKNSCSLLVHKISSFSARLDRPRIGF